MTWDAQQQGPVDRLRVADRDDIFLRDSSPSSRSVRSESEPLGPLQWSLVGFVVFRARRTEATDATLLSATRRLPVLHTTTNLAKLRLLQGRLGEAEEIYMEILASLGPVIDEQHHVHFKFQTI
jgi:hypothetical protein